MADKYKNYEELVANEPTGSFLITYKHYGLKDVIVLVPHGGGIEGGTSELGDDIRAYRDLSLYMFEGRKTSGNSDLHITSTNFDAPFSRESVANHKKSISFHGYRGNDGEKHTLIGGTDRVGANLLCKYLIGEGFSASVVEPGGHLGGTDPENIANQTITGLSVQVEISLAQRKAMFDNFSLIGRESSKNSEYRNYLDAVLGFMVEYEESAKNV